MRRRNFQIECTWMINHTGTLPEPLSAVSRTKTRRDQYVRAFRALHIFFHCNDEKLHHEKCIMKSFLTKIRVQLDDTTNLVVE